MKRSEYRTSYPFIKNEELIMLINEYNAIIPIEFKINPEIFNFTGKYNAVADFTYNNKLYSLYFYEVDGKLLLVMNNNYTGFIYYNKVLHAQDFDFIFYNEIITEKTGTLSINNVLSIYKLGILTDV